MAKTNTRLDVEIIIRNELQCLDINTQITVLKLILAQKKNEQKELAKKPDPRQMTLPGTAVIGVETENMKKAREAQTKGVWGISEQQYNKVSSEAIDDYLKEKE